MTVKTVEYEGFQVRPGTSDKTAVDEVFVKRGYERRDFKPEAGDVWADIGANIGAFARTYADQVKGIYAYEPSPETFEVLKANTKDKLNVINVPVAVGDKSGTIEFYERPKQNWRNGTRNIFKDGVLTFVEVMAVQHLPKEVNALKIDCEGSEYDIMQVIDLTPFNKLVMEWSFDYHPEIDKYREAVKKLEKHFDVVKAGNVKGDIWKKSWFPPAKMIVAYNKG